MERPAYPDAHCRLCPDADATHLYRHPVCLYAPHPDPVEAARRRRGLPGRRICQRGAPVPAVAGIAREAELRLVLPVFPLRGRRPARPAVDRNRTAHRGVRPDGNANLSGRGRDAADTVYIFSAVAAHPVVLPYEPDSTHSHTKLIMTPKKGQPVDLVCYYDVEDNKTYDIVWESREATASDWTQHQKNTITFDANTVLHLDGFLAQDQETMIRVIAYETGTDEVVKAIVVGFDFRVANYGTANALPQKNYDLSTATGVVAFKDRVAAWGLPADPTILFISDYNEPAYFPYPNNIIVFDEPVIHCVEFMGTLVVFTIDKIYQVTQADDGFSWNSEVIQTHLSIDPWDKHLIKTVRNMLYFKSGNYYYMMVPKARSVTGELTVAPITTPITSFFDRFSVNIQELLRYTYGYTGHYELLTYYNYLDYDEIHNIYAFRFDTSLSVMHFDVIYNTNDRTWKIWIFESANLVFPYRQEATRLGTLASTSLVRFEDIGDGSITGQARIIQFFSWDHMLVRSCYIPHNCELAYNPGNDNARTARRIFFRISEWSISNRIITILSEIISI